MPMFLFACTSASCGTEYEAFCTSYKSDFPKCPDCGADTKRLIGSAPGVSLKGTGWAQDGYSCTDMGAKSASDNADKKGVIKSFPGQKVRGR